MKMPVTDKAQNFQPGRLRSGTMMKLNPPIGACGGAKGGESEFHGMVNNVANMATRLDRMETKIDSMGQAVRALQKETTDLKIDVQTIKTDMSWIKWVVPPVCVAVVIAAFVYLFNRQDALSDQILGLLQQIATK